MALSVVLDYYNIKIDPDTIFYDIYNYTQNAVSTFDMLIYATKLGLDATLYSSNIEDLRKNINNNIPLILALGTNSKIMHFVVVYGLSEEGNYLIYDSGKYKIILTKESLQERWVENGAVALRILKTRF